MGRVTPSSSSPTSRLVSLFTLSLLSLARADGLPKVDYERMGVVAVGGAFTGLDFYMPNATTSSLYSTLSAFAASFVEMPSASASRALRFAIAHSFVHFGGARSFLTLPVQLPQRTLCLLRPQGQLSVTSA